MYATRYGNDVTVSLLLNSGAEINATNLKRQTALYQAVVGEHASLVSLMLKRDADPNIRSDTGYTALHYAAKMGLNVSIRALLEGGAEHATPTEEGHTALFLAKKYEQVNAEALLVAYAETGSCAAVGDVELETADDEDAALMRELEAMELHPDVQKVQRVKEFKAPPGTLSSSAPPPAPTAATAPDGEYGKVSVGGPTPDMMMQKSGGARPADVPEPAAGPTPPAAALKEPAYATVDISKKTPKPVQVIVPEQTYIDGKEAGNIYDNTEANSDLQPKVESKEGTYAVPETYESAAKSAGGGYSVPETYESALTSAPKCAGSGYSVPEPFKSKLVPDEEPDYASVDEVIDTPASARVPAGVPAATTGGSDMDTFLSSLGLVDKCKALAEEAGIDEPSDFKMFTEAELVSVHNFKTGHVRKILMALGNADC